MYVVTADYNETWAVFIDEGIPACNRQAPCLLILASHKKLVLLLGTIFVVDMSPKSDIEQASKRFMAIERLVHV